MWYHIPPINLSSIFFLLLSLFNLNVSCETFIYDLIHIYIYIYIPCSHLSTSPQSHYTIFCTSISPLPILPTSPLVIDTRSVSIPFPFLFIPIPHTSTFCNQFHILSHLTPHLPLSHTIILYTYTISHTTHNRIHSIQYYL